MARMAIPVAVAMSLGVVLATLSGCTKVGAGIGAGVVSPDDVMQVRLVEVLDDGRKLRVTLTRLGEDGPDPERLGRAGIDVSGLGFPPSPAGGGAVPASALHDRGVWLQVQRGEDLDADFGALATASQLWTVASEALASSNASTDVDGPANRGTWALEVRYEGAVQPRWFPWPLEGRARELRQTVHEAMNLASTRDAMEGL